MCVCILIKKRMIGLDSVVLLIFVIVLFVASVVMVIVGDKKRNDGVFKGTIPPLNLDIDVVLVDMGRGRLDHQIACVHTFMGWVRKIIVLKTTPPPPSVPKGDGVGGVKPPVHVVQIDEAHDLFDMVENIQGLFGGISENFIFLGDSTVPIRKVSASHMYSESRKRRVFNLGGHSTGEIDGGIYRERTVPVFIVNRIELEKSGTLGLYILSLTLADKVVYCPHINHMVLLTNDRVVDVAQIETTIEPHRYFMTVLIATHLDHHAHISANEVAIEAMSTANVPSV